MAHGVPHPVKGQRFLEKRTLNLRSEGGRGFGEGVAKAEGRLHEGLREERTARPTEGEGGSQGRPRANRMLARMAGSDQIQKGLGRR